MRIAAILNGLKNFLHGNLANAVRRKRFVYSFLIIRAFVKHAKMNLVYRALRGTSTFNGNAKRELAYVEREASIVSTH